MHENYYTTRIIEADVNKIDIIFKQPKYEMENERQNMTMLNRENNKKRKRNWVSGNSRKYFH